MRKWRRIQRVTGSVLVSRSCSLSQAELLHNAWMRVWRHVLRAIVHTTDRQCKLQRVHSNLAVSWPRRQGHHNSSPRGAAAGISQQAGQRTAHGGYKPANIGSSTSNHLF